MKKYLLVSLSDKEIKEAIKEYINKGNNKSTAKCIEVKLNIINENEYEADLIIDTFKKENDEIIIKDIPF